MAMGQEKVRQKMRQSLRKKRGQAVPAQRSRKAKQKRKQANRMKRIIGIRQKILRSSTESMQSGMGTIMQPW